MTRVLLIGFAGGLGTLCRYGVGVWAGRTLGSAFPYGTLTVNVVGCFLIALVSGLAASTAIISPTLRLTLMTGFVGGFTTYSSFNYETTNLLRERGVATAGANLALTLVACFVAGWLGLLSARAVTT